jgi:tetratricopeptide (TPR) repeat protein
MLGTLTADEEAQLLQTIEMFEVITQSQPQDYQSLEILKEAYLKLGRSKDAISTSKRIAEAYVQLGQLSSAILEYETILQHCPEDTDVLAAMASLESKATDLTALMAEPEAPAKPAGRSSAPRKSAADIDDGRKAMQKIFVEGKLITASDFDTCWKTPDLDQAPSGVIEPFIQVLAAKSLLPIEQSLKAIAEKTRVAFLPVEKYDFDLDLARSFSKDVCRRWCILPFDHMSKTVMIATANPFNKQAAEEIQQFTDQRLLWYLASPVELTRMLQKIHRH